MERSDWLLLLFDGADRPLDRVRIQKAMFLFAMRSTAPEEQKYAFEPYNYGPFSFALYPELSRLVREGLLATESVSWMSSPVYSLSAEGSEATKELKRNAPPRRLTLLYDLREWVMARSFTQLLNDIYARYPDYAVNSVFRH
jgi:hypothetical protein